MKRIIIPIIFVMFTSLLMAIDVIGPVSGNWSTAQSPVNVIGEIELLSGDQLIIEPGVEVIFDGHFKFNIFGRLLAIGEEGNNITFTASDEVSGWHGLRFFDTVSNGQDSSKLVYCILEYGNATGVSPNYRGGAIYCSNSSDLLISNSIVRNNSSLSAGAGLYIDESDIIIISTKIYGNEASGAGGGIFMLNSDPTLEHVEIYNNNSYNDGGGINCYSSNPDLNYVAIYGNTTQWNGGGLSAYNNSTINMTNVTFSENFSPQDGCGIAVLYNSSVYLLNSIIWDNYPYEIYISNSAYLSVDYSNIHGGVSGITSFGTFDWLEGGNINVDPLFVDPNAGDFSLQGDSPCIDAGDPDPVYIDPDGTRNDMGAYNYLQAGIRGFVDVTSGVGDVENVEISIYLANTQDLVATLYPNEEGVYFMSIEPGTYDVTAYLASYHPNPSIYEDIVVYSEQLTTGIDFDMNLIAQGSIFGIVIVEGNGNPGDVVIVAGEEETNPIYDSINGFWWYELFLNPGYYDVTASLVNFQDSTITSVLVQSSQQTSGQNFRMIPITFDGIVTGTVRLIGGTGDILDVGIQIEGDDDIYNPDENGFYAITYQGGFHNISAFLDGYSTVTLENIVIVEDQTTPDVDFVLINWVPEIGNQYAMSRLISLTLDGQFICGGLNNQVAAFHVDQLGVETCRGVAEWDNSGFWFVHIASNEQAGETIYFKVYESYTEEIYTSLGGLEFEDCTYDDAVYGYYVPSPQRTHTYDLITNEVLDDWNWNWVSFNLFPEDFSFATILDPLTDFDDIYQIRMEGNFYTYEYEEWTGDLPYLSNQESYKIFMHNPFEGFEFQGTAINPDLYPILLEEDYNWISYIPLNEMSLENALSNLNWPDSLMIKTQSKSAIHFPEYGGWIGDLETMEPGVGYILYWPEEIPEGEILYFTYPGNPCYSGPEEERSFVQQKIPDQIWEIMDGTRFNMILLAEILDDNGDNLDPLNYSIGIFDSDGNCRSIGLDQNDLYYFTIVGNTNNEELHFRIYDHSNNKMTHLDDSILFEINSILGNPAEPYSARLNTPENNIPNIFGLSQNHPNPFNPSTSISYTLPVDGQVSLEIYNIKGQLIQTLIDEFKNAGHFQVTFHLMEYSLSNCNLPLEVLDTDQD